MPEQGRVIAGSARGVRLEAPARGTRPLSDRVKQSLFATLEARGALDGGFLDLFAGTGAAGIEALSRGAARAVFVERDAHAAQTIEANLRRARLSGAVVRVDVLRYLAAGRPADVAPFGACLIDPPYDTPLVQPVLELLGDPGLGWLADDGLALAKHFWRAQPPQTVGALTLAQQRRFGETMISFYTRVAQDEPSQSQEEA